MHRRWLKNSTLELKKSVLGVVEGLWYACTTFYRLIADATYLMSNVSLATALITQEMIFSGKQDHKNGALKHSE